MKCPKCGADDSVVLETRAYMDVFLRRRRMCFNNHSFSTYEVTRGVLRHDKVAQARTLIGDKIKAWTIRLKIKASNAPSTALSAELGIHDSSVRRIRRELQ